MKRLHLDMIEYEYYEDATFEKEGKEYSFVSLKKITTLVQNKKKMNQMFLFRKINGNKTQSIY